MTNHTYVIAEAGVNHNGSVETAKKLIDVAADAGADAVKFQTFKAELLVTKTAEKAEYQKTRTNESSQYEMLKRLELSVDDHHELVAYSESNQIQFLSTGFDLESLRFLSNLGVPLFKIPSGDITNYPLIQTIAEFGKPVIVSTGMATIEEIANCLSVLKQHGIDNGDITVLHCNTQYPTPMSDVNLTAMNTIKDHFGGIKVGYSDHTLGIEIPIAAVALGATVIEKHFTLDQTMPGPDHAASLNPKQLADMVVGIRNIEIALGNGIKYPTASESPNIPVARKSIVAAKMIKTGETFTAQNITTKRPGSGRSPMDWPNVIGQTATRDYEPDEQID